VVAWRVNARVFACPNCGAKLHYRADVPVVECRYCHAHVVVETRRTTHLPAQVVSNRPPRNGLWVAVALGVVFTGAIGSYIASSQRTTRPTTPAASPQDAASPPSPKERRSTMAELAATPLAATPREVAERHGVKPDKDSVEIRLSDGPFDRAYLRWHAPGADHVTQIGLYGRDREDELAEVVARAHAQLGRRMRKAAAGGLQLSSQGWSLHISAAFVQAAVKHEDPRWRARFEAVWTLVKGAALGRGDRIDDHARRDLLNLGYALPELAGIDLEAVVDDAGREVQRIAAGAEDHGDRHEIGLAHPWFEGASLRWQNKPGGKLTSMLLHAVEDVDLTSHADALAACLRPVIGEPRRQVTDHLARKFTLRFEPPGLRPALHVGPTAIGLWIDLGRGRRATPAAVHAVFEALGACGA
jgi:DNA-directed RNA polymerase subunit RPC12/RpoP